MKILAKFTSFLDHLGHGVLVVAGGLWRTRKKTFLWLKKTALKIYTTIVAFLDWLGNLIIALVSFIISKIKHSRWGKTQFSKTLSLVWQRRHSKNRPVLWGAVFVLIIFLPLALLRLKTPQETEAGWFNDGWGYRKSVAITNAGADQTDYQVAITLDTAALITAGKMQSDCDDIRITDHQGKVLPYWIEESGAYACNDSDTKIWTKAPSLPTSGATILVYYGNSSATSATSGDSTFEFFDDFSSPSIDSAKWTQGTIGTTTGTDFSQASGLLSDGNTNRYIQSTTAYTGNYAASTRVYTTTSAANGYTTVGFWASTSNNFGILDHNGTTYIRNDSSWPNYSYNGSGQWNRDEVRVTGTSATHWRTGETSGSTTAGNTNSGLSSEYLRLGARYDSSASNQNFVADWDWIFVRKTTTTEPSVGSPTNEEKSPAPVAHWKFDEGYGTTANDSSGQEKNGTFLSAPIWKTEDQCISGKCLAFDNVDDGVSITNQNFTSLTDYTMCSWVNPKGNHKNYTGTIMSSGDWNVSHWAFGISQNNATIQTRRADGTNSPGWNYSFPLSQWTYVCLTRSGATITAYANGKQVGSPYTGTTGNLISNATNTTIGRETYAGGYFAFNGFIDEPKIYPYARTAAQIKSDYAGRGSSEGVSASFGASEQQNFLSEGLVGYWKMDEASGNAADSSGNSHTATLVNSPSYSGGKFGNSISLSTNQGATVASSTPLNSSYITASAWIYPTASSAELMITNKESSFEWALKSGALQWAMYTSSTVWYWHSTGYSPPLNQWTHVTLTYDGNNIITYANGEIKETFSYSGTIATSGVVNIGCRGGTCNTSYWSGKLDEVRIYNRALSPADVRDLYNWAPGPVAHYKMDEATGTTVNDVSGNGNLASFSGSPSWVSGKFGKGISTGNTTSDYINAPNVDINDNWTAMSWFKYPLTSTGSSWHTLFRGSNEDHQIIVQRSDMVLGMYDNGGAGYRSSGFDFDTLSNGWHHIATVGTGSVQNFYIDGVYVGQADAKSSDNIKSIGNYWGGNQNWGTIDDVRIYNYARTPGQIIEDMNAGHPIGGSPISSKIGYWKFDEGYGTTAYDEGIGGNNFTLYASPSWSNNGKFGKTLNYNGSTQYSEMSESTTDINLSTEGSITAWIYLDTVPASSSLYSIVSEGGISGIFGPFHEIYNNSFPRLSLWQDGDINQWTYGDTDFTNLTGQWVHTASVWNGTTVKLYVNGVLDGSADRSGNTGNGTKWGVGRNPYNNSRYFDGKIDEVKIYSTALTADEILIDMNQGASSVMGAIGTDASGNASFSGDRSYCPPGDTTASCSPIAEWKFDEKTGITAQDTSGNGNTGTLGGSASWTNGQTGAAIKFSDATDGKVTFSSSVLNTPPYTVCAWAKPDSITDGDYHYVIANGGESGGYYGFYIYLTNTGTWAFGVRNSSGLTGSASIAASNTNWAHVCGTWDGTSSSGAIKLYVNGSLATGTAAGTSSVSAANLKIGGASLTDSYNWDGKIDHVKIYDYARTPAQVAYDYNRGGPIAHYRFDECQGNTINDITGNGNDLTISIGSLGTQDGIGTCSDEDSSNAWNNGTTGKFNASINTDGTDDYIYGASGTALDGNNESMFFWVKSSGGGYGLMLSQAGWMRRFFGTAFTIVDSDIVYHGLDASGANDGNWHHVGYTFSTSDDNIRSYVDGVLKETESIGAAANIRSTQVYPYFGRYCSGASCDNYRAGQIDDVQIFNYALTPTQIKTLFNGSAIRFGPSEGAP